ncbi:hypothetical protein [Limimaricola sp. AA108-03]|uniref:hypothetical protein n=1 Tax=Limimaricola sp. AA108-03 TaxID=3425945 RepID=UPI003D773149
MIRIFIPLDEHPAISERNSQINAPRKVLLRWLQPELLLMAASFGRSVSMLRKGIHAFGSSLGHRRWRRSRL